MTLRYEVVPGEGLIARYSDNIVWVGLPVEEAAWDALGAVLELAPGTQPDGGDTAAQLATLHGVLDDHPKTVFAALLVDGDQAQGVLRGPVTVCNAVDVAPATGHDQFGVTVPFPMTEAVYVGFHQPVANPPKISELLDLDAGVVPGAGAWVHPASEGRRHSGAVPIKAAEPAETATPPAQAPPPSAEMPTPAAPTPQRPQVAPVTGFTPASDHERVDLRDVSTPATPQPLPPIGVPDESNGPTTENRGDTANRGKIVFDDGSTFELDRDYVVGRRPEKDPRVQSGTAEPLTVVDPDSVLSSAHALVSIKGPDVLLRDLGSLNGTHVAPPGAVDWTRLQQHQELPIVPGTRLLFGWTVATYTDTDS